MLSGPATCHQGAPRSAPHSAQPSHTTHCHTDQRRTRQAPKGKTNKQTSKKRRARHLAQIVGVARVGPQAGPQQRLGMRAVFVVVQLVVGHPLQQHAGRHGRGAHHIAPVRRGRTRRHGQQRQRRCAHHHRHQMCHVCICVDDGYAYRAKPSPTARKTPSRATAAATVYRARAAAAGCRRSASPRGRRNSTCIAARQCDLARGGRRVTLRRGSSWR